MNMFLPVVLRISFLFAKQFFLGTSLENKSYPEMNLLKRKILPQDLIICSIRGNIFHDGI